MTGFLEVLNTDPNRWASTHHLEPFRAPCNVCGAELETTVPIARRELRGLRAPTCACGNNRTPYCVNLVLR